MARPTDMPENGALAIKPARLKRYLFEAFAIQNEMVEMRRLISS